jgi:DNA-binding NarL/FixJ family response regulator
MRIVMADDHPLVRKGIRATLGGREGIEIVAEAADGEEALRAVQEHKPDLLLLDLSMPGLPPHLLIKRARETQPDLKVLILTACDDDLHLRHLSHLALSGYLLKDEAADHLLKAVQMIKDGAVWFNQSVSDKMRALSRRLSDPDLLALTSRDREVLDHIGRGHDNKLIAEELHLAEQTVRNYISRLYLRIGVSSRAEAVVWARERAVL